MIYIFLFLIFQKISVIIHFFIFYMKDRMIKKNVTDGFFLITAKLCIILHMSTLQIITLLTYTLHYKSI